MTTSTLKNENVEAEAASASAKKEDEIEDMSEEEKMLADIEAEQAKSEAKESTLPTVAPTLIRSSEAKDKGSQLDELLNKASEYSAFISGDMKQLQEEMAMMAEMDDKKRGKKRKPTGEEAKSMAEYQSMNADYKKDQKKAIFTQPPNLAKSCTLKDYQLEGIRWMASLYENGVSGILADEMGLGKTIQVIALFAHLLMQGTTGPFLVVAPLATLPNWIREFEKWLPTLPCIRYHGTKEERAEFFMKIDPVTKQNIAPLKKKDVKAKHFPVIITSYEVAIRDVKKLSSLGPYTYMVVDEGQRLKNRKCCLIKSLKVIEAQNRLLLSGTPIQNDLDELWSLLNFVNPTIFDDLSVFQSWFGFKNIGQETTEGSIMKNEREEAIVSKLHDILRPFLLRRVKMDVLSDMPPKKEVVVYAGMSKLQRGYHANIEKGILRAELMKAGIKEAHMISQINTLMNHRKNSNHPFLFGEPIDNATGQHVGTAHPQLLIRASGKFHLLDRMLTKLHEKKHQVLIFSQMTEVLSIIEDYLVWREWKYCRIDGSTKIDERQRQMDAFNAEKTNGAGGKRNDNDDRHFVFLLSTRAGGLGINLASADTCIIFDSDWNPHQDSQAMDRCHRIGQDRPVAVYRLLTAGSVDMEMMEKQISKKKLDRMAIAGGDFRKGGSRSKSDKLNHATLEKLLEDDIHDFANKSDNIEDIRIDDDELDGIMDRQRLFEKGSNELKAEGRMYDILESKTSDNPLEAFS